MKIIFSILAIILVIFLSKVDCIRDLCFNSIKKLADKDRCLSSRIDTKIEAANQSSSKPEFVFKVVTSKCIGKDWACGKTLSYVSEVYQGLLDQYKDYKVFDGQNGEKFGWFQVIGDDIFKLFEANKNKYSSRIIYQMRHTGTQDHVWLIDQLENNQGYRIYQSYHEAYSLKAWLSQSLDGLYKNDNSGEIVLFYELKNTTNKFIQLISNGKCNISNFDSSPEIPAQYKPFLKFVRDYGAANATELFRKSWEKFGKGQILSWNQMTEYLIKLSNMTSAFSKYENTATFLSQLLYDDWIYLYAAADPVNYPNLPHNAITQHLFQPQRQYRFEIKTVLIKYPLCMINSLLIY